MSDLLREVEEAKDVIHVPLCREEEGMGICAGGYLVGKKCAAIMQNGGFFNSNNAIVSTLLQYQIPLLLLIYYAGDIGDRTFATTGSMTEPVLQALGIRYYVMRDIGDAPELIKRAQILAEDAKKPVALLLTKEVLGRRPALKSLVIHFVTTMKRFDCLKALAAEVKDALVVSSAGAMTLEWNSLHPSDGNFRVRTLGLCSSIALGMALGLPHRKVVALDGDGSLLMNLCSLPTIARMRPTNLVHIVFDNEVYEASGSKKTATGAGADLVGIARAAGIKNSHWAKTVDEFAKASGSRVAWQRTMLHRRQSQHRKNRGAAVSDR